MDATWKKLEDGSWGIYVQAQQAALLPLLVGQEVEVFRKNGSRSLERVTEVVKLVAVRGSVRVKGGRYLAAVTTPAAVWHSSRSQRLAPRSSRWPRTRRRSWPMFRKLTSFRERTKPRRPNVA